MVEPMTDFEILIEWLKTCPVDYIRHGTMNIQGKSGQIVVTFDVSSNVNDKLNNLNQVTSEEHNELILERKTNG